MQNNNKLNLNKLHKTYYIIIIAPHHTHTLVLVFNIKIEINTHYNQHDDLYLILNQNFMLLIKF